MSVVATIRDRDDMDTTETTPIPVFTPAALTAQPVNFKSRVDCRSCGHTCILPVDVRTVTCAFWLGTSPQHLVVSLREPSNNPWAAQPRLVVVSLSCAGKGKEGPAPWMTAAAAVLKVDSLHETKGQETKDHDITVQVLESAFLPEAKTSPFLLMTAPDPEQARLWLLVRYLGYPLGGTYRLGYWDGTAPAITTVLDAVTVREGISGLKVVDHSRVMALIGREEQNCVRQLYPPLPLNLPSTSSYWGTPDPSFTLQPALNLVPEIITPKTTAPKPINRHRKAKPTQTSPSRAAVRSTFLYQRPIPPNALLEPTLQYLRLTQYRCDEALKAPTADPAERQRWTDLRDQTAADIAFLEPWLKKKSLPSTSSSDASQRRSSSDASQQQSSPPNAKLERALRYLRDIQRNCDNALMDPTDDPTKQQHWTNLHAQATREIAELESWTPKKQNPLAFPTLGPIQDALEACEAKDGAASSAADAAVASLGAIAEALLNNWGRFETTLPMLLSQQHAVETLLTITTNVSERKRLGRIRDNVKNKIAQWHTMSEPLLKPPAALQIQVEPTLALLRQQQNLLDASLKETTDPREQQRLLTLRDVVLTQMAQALPQPSSTADAWTVFPACEAKASTSSAAVNSSLSRLREDLVTVETTLADDTTDPAERLRLFTDRDHLLAQILELETTLEAGYQPERTGQNLTVKEHNRIVEHQYSSHHGGNPSGGNFSAAKTLSQIRHEALQENAAVRRMVEELPELKQRFQQIQDQLAATTDPAEQQRLAEQRDHMMAQIVNFEMAIETPKPGRQPDDHSQTDDDGDRPGAKRKHRSTGHWGDTLPRESEEKEEPADTRAPKAPLTTLQAQMAAHLREEAQNRGKLQQTLADLRQQQTVLEIRIDETKDKDERKRLRVLLDNVIAQILQYEML